MMEQENTIQVKKTSGGKVMFDLFGEMFDFNNDGKVDAIERAVEIDIVSELIATTEDELETELELSGLDLDELEYMDADERREVLEEAGLDPDDYDV